MIEWKRSPRLVVPVRSRGTWGYTLIPVCRRLAITRSQVRKIDGDILDCVLPETVRARPSRDGGRTAQQHEERAPQKGCVDWYQSNTFAPCSARHRRKPKRPLIVIAN